VETNATLFYRLVSSRLRFLRKAQKTEYLLNSITLLTLMTKTRKQLQIIKNSIDVFDYINPVVQTHNMLSKYEVYTEEKMMKYLVQLKTLFCSDPVISSGINFFILQKSFRETHLLDLEKLTMKYSVRYTPGRIVVRIEYFNQDIYDRTFMNMDRHELVIQKWSDFNSDEGTSCISVDYNTVEDIRKKEFEIQ